MMDIAKFRAKDYKRDDLMVLDIFEVGLQFRCLRYSNEDLSGGVAAGAFYLDAKEVAWIPTSSPALSW